MKKGVLFLTGIEDFSTIIEKNAYYVDKTPYLKDLLMSDSEVLNALFIRPRRFGKTLNMNMIKSFCELNYQNPGDKSYQQKLFIDNGRNLAIAGDDYKEFREKIMGEFPVIGISFRGIEGENFPDALSQLILKIAEIYEKFSFLAKSSRLSSSSIQNYIDNWTFCNTKQEELNNPENLQKAVTISSSFISKIALMLQKEFDRKVIVLIDEYDVPLQKAVIAKEPYYEEMLNIIKK